MVERRAAEACVQNERERERGHQSDSAIGNFKLAGSIINRNLIRGNGIYGYVYRIFTLPEVDLNKWHRVIS